MQDSNELVGNMVKRTIVRSEDEESSLEIERMDKNPVKRGKTTKPPAADSESEMEVLSSAVRTKQSTKSKSHIIKNQKGKNNNRLQSRRW